MAMPTGEDDPTCPLLVPGTSISVEDSTDGAALVFVTTGDVADVRKRAAALAKMHDDHGGSGMGAMISSPAIATATDIEGGSRIAFVATGDEVAKVKEELRMHAHHLSAGSCKMAM
jgi:hypothetical protein